MKHALPGLMSRYPISKMGVFGSALRDDYVQGKSDIDVLVHFNGEMGWEFFDLENELALTLGGKVDLVAASALRPYFWDAIKDSVRYV